MTNHKVLAVMGVMAALAVVVARITLFRNKVLPLSPSSFTLAEVTSLPEATSSIIDPKGKELILADFRYTGAETVSLGNNSLVLKSSDEPETVTAWYQKKLTEMDLNIRNFIQTNANGKIKNQLSGVGEKGKITVAIDKESASATVKILVTVSHE
jgi:hypothetical protein